jgi:hypothetical protein
MPLIDPEIIKDQFDEAHKAMRPLWDNFDEYERIAYNRPHPKVISAKLPTVTDGTLAGIIAKTPKRVIQQIPTGRVKSLDQPELAEIADYIWTNYILKNANYNGSPLIKSWMMLRRALTHGCAVSYAFFKNSGEYYGADFSLPYIRDVIFESGKMYGPDCDILYLRQWYTKAQIQLIIDRQKKMSAKDKKFESQWNIQLLEDLLTKTKAKDADARSQQEREKGLINTKFIEIIHAFQVGIGAKFYSFSPDLAKLSIEGSPIVRTQVNPDPRGKMPISFLYADVDLSHALGIGVPEMSGGMQNLLDSEVQAYQLMTKIMLNPPLKRWGSDMNKATIKWKASAIWDMGASRATSDIEPVNIETAALANFPNNYGLIKSQIMNTAPQDSTTVAAQAGNTQSKTHAGVQQLQTNLGYDDNYLRKQYESWWEDNAETMLNIHFAMSNGTREIELTEEWLNDKSAALQQAQDNQLVAVNPEKQKALVAYSAIKTKLKFEVDPTTSESPDDADQVVKLQELLTEAQGAPYLYYYLLNAGYKLNLGEAYKQMFHKLGLQNVDKIVEELDEEQKQNLPQELRGVLNPLYDKPKIDVSYQDLPPAGQIQAAANAGITLTMADVLAGPVLDVNERGVVQKFQPPQSSWPTGPNQAAMQPAAPGTPGQPPQPGEPPMATQPLPAANPPQPTAMPQAQPQNPPAAAPAAPQEGMDPTHRNLLQKFLLAGYSAKQAMAALELARQGRTSQEIVKALGQPEGLSSAKKAQPA